MIQDEEKKQKTLKNKSIFFSSTQVQSCADKVEDFCSDVSVVLLFIFCFPIDEVAQQCAIPALYAAFL